MGQVLFRSLVLFIFLIFSSFKVMALSGAGTSADPWKINNIADFQDFCTDSEYWLAGTFTDLETDIDLSGMIFTEALIAPDLQTNSWYQGAMYSGSFDGKGHVVKNLKIIGDDNTWYMSLFGYVGHHGTVENLGVIDCDITGGYRVSGICGWN